MKNHFYSRNIRLLAAFLLAATLSVLTGCSDNTVEPTSGTTVTVISAASLQLSAAPTTVKSDNSNSTTITITAVDAGNAVVASTPVSISADTGNLSIGTATTNSTGKATLTFSSGAASKFNRTATITVTAGGVTAQIPVQIVGSTVAVNPATATLPDDGSSPKTLTITAKDAGGNPVQGAAVALTTTGSGNVTLTPSSGTTDINGQLSVVVAGASGGAGNVTVTATTLGSTATSAITVSPSAATFAIDQQRLNAVLIANNSVTAMYIGDALEVRVNTPAPTSNVVFASTIGDWNGSASSVVVVPVVAGKATATLTTAGAGVANVQVYDQAVSATSDSFVVTMSAAASAAAKITIQPSPALVPKSTGSTIGFSTLTASVMDVNGFPVGGAPVAFEIINPTGGGETVSPVVVFSALTTTGGLALGEARTTFTSGSLSSGQPGVQVRARVVGMPVETEAQGVDVTASGNDAAIIIGGTAGSVTFGQATVLTEGANLSTYILPMSVLVADSNGNPVPGTTVNLSVWPIAWSTGSVCTVDADTATTGTFFNEDVNENLSLDPGEDGTRRYYLSGTTVVGGNLNSQITAPNSSGGLIPGTVITNANGVATFNLEYSKTDAIWIVDRIRARTVVQGTETVGETRFRLAPLQKDVVPCLLPPSSYYF